MVNQKFSEIQIISQWSRQNWKISTSSIRSECGLDFGKLLLIDHLDEGGQSCSFNWYKWAIKIVYCVIIHDIFFKNCSASRIINWSSWYCGLLETVRIIRSHSDKLLFYCEEISVRYRWELISAIMVHFFLFAKFGLRVFSRVSEIRYEHLWCRVRGKTFAFSTRYFEYFVYI